MAALADELSLFQIDAELDQVIEEIQELNLPNEELPTELIERFQVFCQAFGEKIDRIGRFIRLMESREQYCRQEADRLLTRARSAESKAMSAKSMVMYFLNSRGLTKLEGQAFAFRLQRNSQDSVKIVNQVAVPRAYCRARVSVDGSLWTTILSMLPVELGEALQRSVEEFIPDIAAIKSAKLRNEPVPGTEVRRGSHLRVV